MRCFISLDFESKELERLKQEFKIEGLKLSEGLHCTLLFLGDKSEKEVEEIKLSLKSIKLKQFSVHVSKLGAFPNETRPNVVWLGLEPEEDIKTLQHAVEKACSMKDERFSSHITLARVKFVKDRNELLSKFKLKIPKESFTVKEFKFIKSTLTETGPIYEVLETYKAE